jgi:hypothetical protein
MCNNNNNLLQYCHMRTYNSSSHYILLRESVILYLYWYIFNPFMVFDLKLWMTKYSGIQHCMLLLYPCCMHICNDFFFTCSNNAWSICSDFPWFVILDTFYIQGQWTCFATRVWIYLNAIKKWNENVLTLQARVLWNVACSEYPAVLLYDLINYSQIKCIIIYCQQYI